VKYEIKAKIFLDSKVVADQVWNALEAIKLKIKNVADSGESSEFSYIETHHDETPPKACNLVKKIILTKDAKAEASKVFDEVVV